MVSHRPGWRGAPLRFASSGAREYSVSALVAEAPSFRPSSVHPRACRVYGYGGTAFPAPGQSMSVSRRRRSCGHAGRTSISPTTTRIGETTGRFALPLLVRPHELARKRGRAEPLRSPGGAQRAELRRRRSRGGGRRGRSRRLRGNRQGHAPAVSRVVAAHGGSAPPSATSPAHRSLSTSFETLAGAGLSSSRGPRSCTTWLSARTSNGRRNRSSRRTATGSSMRTSTPSTGARPRTSNKALLPLLTSTLYSAAGSHTTAAAADNMHLVQRGNTIVKGLRGRIRETAIGDSCRSRSG